MATDYFETEVLNCGLECTFTRSWQPNRLAKTEPSEESMSGTIQIGAVILRYRVKQS